jgi:hypothetical protein
MSELIDVLLAESELPDDPALRQLLGELEREATSVRPMPSAALAALMSPRGTAAGHTATRRPRRPSFAGRGAIIAGVTVIGVVGLGVGAAAASPDARSAIGAGVSAIAHLFETAPATREPAPTKAATPPPALGSTSEPTPTPTTTLTPTPDPSESAGSNSGKDSGKGSGKSGDTHGNGDGNQSGHGNGKG